VRHRIGDYFQQGVGTQVLKVVNIWFDLDAVNAVDLRSVFFVKGQLHIRFAN
jgi:hypothetical protein